MPPVGSRDDSNAKPTGGCLGRGLAFVLMRLLASGAMACGRGFSPEALSLRLTFPHSLAHRLLRRVLGCELIARGFGCNGPISSHGRRELGRCPALERTVWLRLVVVAPPPSTAVVSAMGESKNRFQPLALEDVQQLLGRPAGTLVAHLPLANS